MNSAKRLGVRRLAAAIGSSVKKSGARAPHSKAAARLLLILLLLPAPAAAVDFFGPIRVRDLSPMSSMRLDMVPPHGCHSDEFQSVLRVDYSEANVFIVTDNAAQYLRRRGSATALDPVAVRALLDGAKGDVFLYDAEVAVADVEYIRKLNDQWHVRVEWPVSVRSGGGMDRMIESFHRHTGLNSANRDLISRNDVHIVARIGSEELVMLDRGSEWSSGDPVLTAGWTKSFPRRLYLVAEGAVKFPVGDSSRYFSSGKADYGAQVTMQKQYDRNAFYGGANYVWTGDTRVFRSFTMADAVTAGAAWENRFASKTWFLLQGTWSRGAIKPEIHDVFTDDRIQVALGLRHLYGRSFVVTTAMSENLVHFKTTPDFGLHVSVSWLLPAGR